MQVYSVEQFTQIKNLRFPKTILGYSLSQKELFIVHSMGISSFPVGMERTSKPVWHYEQSVLTGEMNSTWDGNRILVQIKTGFLLLDSTGKKLMGFDQTNQASLCLYGKWFVVLQNQEYQFWELPVAKKVGTFLQVPQELQLFPSTRTAERFLWPVEQKPS